MDKSLPFLQRRDRDSNPGCLAAQRFSRPPQSTTLPPLQNFFFKKCFSLKAVQRCDYRRLALYGIDRLIEAKQEDLRNLTGPMTEARIRLREEVAEQIKALKDIKVMGEYYGTSTSKPHPAYISSRSRTMGIHGIPCCL